MSKPRIKRYEEVNYKVKLSHYDQGRMRTLKHHITDKVNSLERIEQNLQLLEKIKEELN